MAEERGSELLHNFVLQVLHVPEDMVDVNSSSTVLALVVLRRQHGALLAVPTDVIMPAILTAGLSASTVDLIGMSTHVTVPAGLLEDLNATAPPRPSEGDLVDVLLVDVSGEVLEMIRPFQNSGISEDVVHPFSFVDSHLILMPEDLAAAAWEWIQDPGSANLLVFYTADEGDTVPETPRPEIPSPKRASRARAQQPDGGEPGRGSGTSKRPTVAQLASSLDQVNQTLPQVVDQLRVLVERQDAMEAQLHRGMSRPSALQQPLGSSAMNGSQRVSFNPTALVREFPPPRSSSMRGSPPSPRNSQAAMEALQLEEEKTVEPGQSDLARAVLARSQALTTLVTQLASGDPIGDLSTGSHTLSAKGAQGRAKLQQELAANKGTFFQSVLQSMARRMQPSRAAD